MALHPALALALALAASAGLACSAPAEPAPSAAAAPSAATPPAEAGPPKPAADWTFDFKDPPAGPRAPVTAAFGATIGTTMFPEVEAHVNQLGLKCSDTSIRAMMDARRETEKAKIADAKARGEDAVTAASWVNKRSKREANPQVRFSCPKVDSDQLGDRKRAPSTGRLLYVFDDATYPLRHTSYQRTHKDHAAGLLDFEDTVAALTKIYGPPTKTPARELPKPDKDGNLEFPSAVNFETAWEYADLAVRANVLRYGTLVTVGERIEVPHGLRPDAPKLASAPATPGTGAAAPPAMPPAAAPATSSPTTSSPTPAGAAPTPAAAPAATPAPGPLAAAPAK